MKDEMNIKIPMPEIFYLLPKVTHESDDLILLTVEDVKAMETMKVLMSKESLESFKKFLEEKNLKDLTITWGYYDYLNDLFNAYYKPPDKFTNFGHIRLIDLIAMNISDKK